MLYALAGLGLLCLYLSVRLICLRRDLRALTEDIRQALRSDSNLRLTTASGDKALREVADFWSQELSLLRAEQQRLENGNSELETAVTNIAHDLRTPLTAISGYLELLEQQPMSEKAGEYSSIIRERTDNLKDLTEELFTYTILDSDCSEPVKEETVLNRELEIALSAAYGMLVDKGIEPEVEICGQNVVRMLDRKALQRIIGNILSNAARYSGGDLRICLRENGTMDFSNSAPSLSEISVGRLFDRYYTVQNAAGSTGLGLSIAKLLTEKMGGSISAVYREGIFSVILSF